MKNDELDVVVGCWWIYRFYLEEILWSFEARTPTLTLRTWEMNDCNLISDQCRWHQQVWDMFCAYSQSDTYDACGCWLPIALYHWYVIDSPWSVSYAKSLNVFVDCMWVVSTKLCQEMNRQAECDLTGRCGRHVTALVVESYNTKRYVQLEDVIDHV